MSKINISAGFGVDANEAETPDGQHPPASAIASMAARMASTAESSYTESVISDLTATILDERLDSLERAEAVVALKSYLQADWDTVARHVGVSGRSLQVIAGIVRLRDPYKESLRLRRIGLRHGAALVRVGETEGAAERLHAYLLLNPDIGGEEALRIAGQMVRQPDLEPERARRMLTEDARRRTLLRGMSDSDSLQPYAAGMGLRGAVNTLSTIDPAALSAAERQHLARELAAALAAIERIQQDMESGGR